MRDHLNKVYCLGAPRQVALSLGSRGSRRIVRITSESSQSTSSILFPFLNHEVCLRSNGLVPAHHRGLFTKENAEHEVCSWTQSNRKVWRGSGCLSLYDCVLPDRKILGSPYRCTSGLMRDSIMANVKHSQYLVKRSRYQPTCLDLWRPPLRLTLIRPSWPLKPSQRIVHHSE